MSGRSEAEAALGLAKRALTQSGSNLAWGEERVVGTRSGALNESLSNGLNTGATYRYSRTAPPGGVYLPKLTYSNWYLQGSAPSELAGPNTITVKASLEYPLGTLTSVTFAGAATADIAAGGNVQSDPVAIFVPAGEVYVERVYASVSILGEKWPLGRYFRSSLSEGYASGDQTGNTSTSFTSTGSGYHATAIHGLPGADLTAPSILLVGDSIFRGSGETDNTGGDAYGNRGYGERGLAQSYSWMTCSRSSDRLEWWLAANALRTANQTGVSSVVVELGINDIYAGSATEAQVRQRMLRVWSYYAAQGIAVFQATITPYTTSTDSWATVSGQSIQVPAQNTVRLAINEWIRTVPGPLSGCIDTAALAESSPNSGKWRVDLGAPTADGLHPSPVMHDWLGAAMRSVTYR